MKKLVAGCTEGASVLELCVQGHKLIEEGTGAVFNKAVKGVKVQKGESELIYHTIGLGLIVYLSSNSSLFSLVLVNRYCFSDMYLRQ